MGGRAHSQRATYRRRQLALASAALLAIIIVNMRCGGSGNPNCTLRTSYLVKEQIWQKTAYCALPPTGIAALPLHTSNRFVIIKIEPDAECTPTSSIVYQQFFANHGSDPSVPSLTCVGEKSITKDTLTDALAVIGAVAMCDCDHDDNGQMTAFLSANDVGPGQATCGYG